MKFCPTCQTRYDEEILRFCTRDGTPLVEENQPSFTELPSENAEDDFSEETVIRRNPPPAPVTEETKPLTKRVVIPTVEKKIAPPPVRTRTVTEYQVQPKKTNTAKIVLLTMLGVIVALGAAIFMVMSGNSKSGNNTNQTNVNANFDSIDTNLNTNLNIDNSIANFNSNIDSGAITNTNTNFNTNINANIKTPTPTPKPSPSQTATPPTLLNTNINLGNSNISAPTPGNTKPTATPTLPPPPPLPRPTPSGSPDNRPVNVGVLNGRAVNLPKPAYPPIARQMRASGQVAVQILIDEAGNVTAAKATSGNALLRAPAEAAARQSKINPVKIGDRNVQAVGILLYNFVNQ